MAALFRAARNIFRRPSSPRLFPTTGFDVIDNKYLVEEEIWDWYSPDEFYPVRIGDVFNSKYQVVGKLGYGAYSTVWLCRDLIEHRHATLKLGSHAEVSRELAVLKHLNSIQTEHVGSLLVRDVLDEFVITRNDRKYQAIVHPPLAITLREFRRMFPDKSLPLDLLKNVLYHILTALDFLHTEAGVIHTDIQEKNVLLGMSDSSLQNDLEKFEQAEIDSPTPRKIIDDGERIIYASRRLVPRKYDYGRPVLCDFGQARFGDFNPMTPIQPYPYRAPEVILDIPWTKQVDIWNVGVLIWTLFEEDLLFNFTGGVENRENDVHHLAHMIALLGPPPKEFLERSKTDRPWQWFDRESGKWKGAAEIPKMRLEDTEKKLQGDEKEQFLRFVRRMLKWKPEERESARELLEDSWFNDIPDA